MSKRRVELTPRQKRYIPAAFRKNRAAIDRSLQDVRRQTMRSHRRLESAVATIVNPETPPKDADGA